MSYNHHLDRIQLLLFFIIELSPLPLQAFDHCEVFLAGGSAKASGEIDLKTGVGSIIGIGLPLSGALDLEGIWRLPLPLEISNPVGQIFSSGSYSRTYHQFSYSSISAGASLELKFLSYKGFIPFLHLSFGKSWLAGSSSDGFSGTNIDWGLGLKYLLLHSWELNLTYLKSDSYFDRLKINGDEDEIPGQISEECRNVFIGISKTFKFGK